MVYICAWHAAALPPEAFDLLQYHARRGEPETGAAVLLGDEGGEPAVLGQRLDELMRVAVGLERAPVLAGETVAEVAHSTTDLEQLVGGGRAHEARSANSLLEPRVIAYAREVVVVLRLLAERREQLDRTPEVAERLVARV